jgi:predicted nucleotidyltransferase component of viral defense system
MIPKGFILEWAGVVPWGEPRQIEQDLIITKALLQLYEHPVLGKAFAFRGGTALNKLIFNPATRYSEDIDLVQVTAEPIGPMINIIRDIMNPWLGKPTLDRNENMMTMLYRVQSDDGFPLKIKIEINTREHFAIMGFQEYQFSCTSSWYQGNAMILSYKIEELLGTKMRALYQRRKGRDLYDLHVALTTLPTLDIGAVIHCFKQYTKNTISRLEFINNVEAKLKKRDFREDIIPLLPYQKIFDVDQACDRIRTVLLEKI